MNNQSDGPRGGAPGGGPPGGGGGGGNRGGAPGSGSRGGKKRVITFSLSPAQLLSSIAGFGIVLVWVFILGVILGKGYAPEAHIPELERLMPKNEQADTPRVITPDHPIQNVDNIDEDESTSAVIPPEDMAYRQSLKGTAQQPSTSSRTQTTAPQQRQNQTAQSTQQPAAQQRNSPTQPAAQQQASAGQQTATQTADTRLYDYVYQVAAYKDQASCDALVQKLKQNGFKASTEKSESNGSTWYKTLIHFRGTPDDVDKLREGLAVHKLDRLIMRSKTPVR